MLERERARGGDEEAKREKMGREFRAVGRGSEFYKEERERDREGTLFRCTMCAPWTGTPTNVAVGSSVCLTLLLLWILAFLLPSMARLFSDHLEEPEVPGVVTKTEIQKLYCKFFQNISLNNTIRYDTLSKLGPKSILKNKNIKSKVLFLKSFMS